MTAVKCFSKIIFRCKWVLFFYFYLFLTISQKKCLEGEWTLWHCCISRKFSSCMYALWASVDMDISMDIHGKSVDMDMDGKFHIHCKPDN